MLDVDGVTVSGRWLRHIPAGGDPAYRPSPPGDNRWQHGAVVDALYLADSEPTVWAEWYRFLAEAAIPPNVSLPRDLWTYEVSALEVADLSTTDRLARVGLAAPQPSRQTWKPFQSIGERLWQSGWRGLLAPSAARDAGLALCIFLTPSRPEEIVARSVVRVDEPPLVPRGMRT